MPAAVRASILARRSARWAASPWPAGPSSTGAVGVSSVGTSSDASVSLSPSPAMRSPDVDPDPKAGTVERGAPMTVARGLRQIPQSQLTQ